MQISHLIRDMPVKSGVSATVLPVILTLQKCTLRLITFISMFWLTENVPYEVTDPNITILFKKGNQSQSVLGRCLRIFSYRDLNALLTRFTLSYNAVIVKTEVLLTEYLLSSN